jgi:hypothetical protein
MNTMLQMIKDMHNHMISFEHSILIDPKPTIASSLQLLTKPDSIQSKETYVCHRYNFYDETHDPATCEPFLFAKE